jgi:hypothetical protein
VVGYQLPDAELRLDTPDGNRRSGFAALGAEFACMAEQRLRVLALIAEFQRALEHSRKHEDALAVLRAILQSSKVYFTLVESLLDKLTSTGAAPHRVEHARILNEMERALGQRKAAGADGEFPELAHAVDALVVREATIHLRHIGTS